MSSNGTRRKLPGVIPNSQVTISGTNFTPSAHFTPGALFELLLGLLFYAFSSANEVCDPSGQTIITLVKFDLEMGYSGLSDPSTYQARCRVRDVSPKRLPPIIALS